MDVFKVAYVYRAGPDFNPIEKFAFVVAKNDRAAIAFIDSLAPAVRDKNQRLTNGNEVLSVSTHVQGVVGAMIPLEPVERRHSAADTRPMPRAERRVGAPDNRPAPQRPVVKGGTAFPERRIALTDTRPIPREERRHGGPDTRGVAA